MEKKTALVLEGGANRGIFTAGVLDYLMENQVVFPYVVGVSAGACNAVDYVSGQIGRTRMCFVQQKAREGRIHSAKRILKTHDLMNMERIFNDFPNKLLPFDYDAYFSSDIECELTVTSCLTGKALYISEKKDRERLMTACRASSSMPVIAPVICVDGIPCLDGGIADSVPLVHTLRKGYKKVCLILTKQKGYRKKENSPLMMRLCEREYGEYPRFLEAVKRRPFQYNRLMDWIDELEEKRYIFVIRPQIKPVSRMETDGEKLLELYCHGYNLMEERMEEFRAYMSR